MERIQERGLSSWQAWGMGNGVHSPETAQDLALVDAGIATGVFGYANIEGGFSGASEALDASQLAALHAEDALAHEQAMLSQGRKSKLALLRGEADGSVRGLRNAVISIGHWIDIGHAPEDAVAAPTVASYAESWRIGWTERLPEIMQLSVDGPLEDMGLEETGHVPESEPVPDPFEPGETAALDLSGQGPSQEGRAFLAEMMAEEDEPEAFIFASQPEPMPVLAGVGAQGAAGELAQHEVMFVESQYAALHGALYDGDAAWDWRLDGSDHEEARFGAHGEGHGHSAHQLGYDGHFV
ncbi:hypothetical protein [Salipiger mangrovisoli]|uniref:Uncharacterized protein n=1 Tax=Salipiger mangrovisoli TaxID=2865933 RepID=A0ABR9WXM3_9RHOB|nr:hypothetical protein [Salipiger mangrovisoli]MBE9636024.1 hypothetical protein [Salipiger mangrovisoli]